MIGDSGVGVGVMDFRVGAVDVMDERVVSE